MIWGESGNEMHVCPTRPLERIRGPSTRPGGGGYNTRLIPIPGWGHGAEKQTVFRTFLEKVTVLELLPRTPTL